MAEHDHLHVSRRDPKPAHVLDHPVRRYASVEQHDSVPPVLLKSHQGRKAGLGDQRVRHAGVGTDASACPRKPTQQRLWPIQPRHHPLIDEQRVSQVVHQDRDLHPIDRLELHGAPSCHVGLTHREILAGNCNTSARRDLRTRSRDRREATEPAVGGRCWFGRRWSNPPPGRTAEARLPHRPRSGKPTKTVRCPAGCREARRRPSA
jgi:hypothetical protein